MCDSKPGLTLDPLDYRDVMEVESALAGKTLEELLMEKAARKKELDDMARSFLAEFELPATAVTDPIDPNSIYGKLIIGSRFKLPKGSKQPPLFRITMAHAHYERVELNEWIELRKAEMKSGTEIVGNRDNDGSIKWFEPSMRSSASKIILDGEGSDGKTVDAATTDAVNMNTSVTNQPELVPRKRRARGGVKHRKYREKMRSLKLAAQGVEAALDDSDVTAVSTKDRVATSTTSMKNLSACAEMETNSSTNTSGCGRVVGTCDDPTSDVNEAEQ